LRDGENEATLAWSRLVERCRDVADGREAIRVANLTIAAQAGALGGLVGRRRRLDGLELAACIEGLAVEPLAATCGSDAAVWRAVSDQAAAFAASLQRPGGMDMWVALFQGADPARKSRGAYATPRTLAEPMARLLLEGHALPRRILDPAAGAGGLLIAVLRRLLPSAGSRREVRGHVLRLHGVELDPTARELASLMIWLVAGERTMTPDRIATQVVVDNAITRDWSGGDPFDALIMNPPWDSLRDQGAVARDRRDPAREETFRRLLRAQAGDPGLPPLYSCQGSGDRNLYKAFTELVPHLIVQGGRIAALLPGAWSSDLGTAPLRKLYLSHMKLDRWTSFENRRGYFPIDGRYKFGILTGERSPAGTGSFQIRAFAADADEVHRRHTRLRREDLRAVGGMAESIPDLTSSAERRLMIRYRRSGVEFFAPEGPFRHVSYRREVDLTEDRKRGAFDRTDRLAGVPRGDGRWVVRGRDALVPLVEGRMVGHYDFYAKSWVEGSGRTARWSWSNGHRLGECRPQYLIAPREGDGARIAICDVTSATNTRTVFASWVPPTWPCGNTAPVLQFAREREALAALAVLNSMVFDWFARRIVAGLHLNRFYLDAMAWPKLEGSEIDRLAGVGALLTRLSPRYGDLSGPKLRTQVPKMSYLEAHVLVERTVAKGYGLSAADLDVLFSPSLSDRRGLWRHFAADPHASAIAQAARELPRASKGPRSRRPYARAPGRAALR
jgi:hypothetical protein